MGLICLCGVYGTSIDGTYLAADCLDRCFNVFPECSHRSSNSDRDYPDQDRVLEVSIR